MVSLNPRSPRQIGTAVKKSAYRDWLRHPKWQRKRLEVMRRDDFRCVRCTDADSELHVHHKTYVAGRKPWEYPLDNFETLCWRCHDLVAKDVRTLQSRLIEEIDGLGLPADVAKLAGCMMARASRPFVEKIMRFVEMFWIVLENDWEMTKLSLGVPEGNPFIRDGATFLDSQVEDEANNWANRHGLLEAYRGVVVAMEELGLPSEPPFFSDDDFAATISRHERPMRVAAKPC